MDASLIHTDGQPVALLSNTTFTQSESESETAGTVGELSKARLNTGEKQMS